jgi:hypothetical protein
MSFMMYQMELFPLQFPVDPLFELRKEIAKIEESGHKVRRGTYAAINKIGKSFTDQENRINEMEHKLWVMEKCLKGMKDDKK